MSATSVELCFTRDPLEKGPSETSDAPLGQLSPLALPCCEVSTIFLLLSAAQLASRQPPSTWYWRPRKSLISPTALRSYLFSLCCLYQLYKGILNAHQMRLLWGFQSTQQISISCLIYLPDSRQPRGHSEWRHLGRCQSKIQQTIYMGQNRNRQDQKGQTS